MGFLDRLTPITWQVNYGPGTNQAGSPYWHCNHCHLGVRGCRDVDHARTLAEDHARTHPGMRAVYYEG